MKFSALFALLAATPAVAGPTAASNCPAGMEAVGGPHKTNTNTVSGSLMDGAYKVMVGGQELKADTPMKIPVGEELDVEVSGDVPFRGFLIRLGSSTEGMSTADTLMSMDEANVQPATSVCVETVSGLTHTGREDKTSVMGTIMIPEPDNGLMLDVTVVVMNTVDGSEYYYTGFALEASDSMAMGMDQDMMDQLARIEAKLDALLTQSCDEAAVAAAETDP